MLHAQAGQFGLAALGQIGQCGGAGAVEAKGGLPGLLQSLGFLLLQDRLRLVHPGGGPQGFAQPRPQSPQRLQSPQAVFVQQTLQAIQLFPEQSRCLEIRYALIRQIRRIPGQFLGLI